MLLVLVLRLLPGRLAPVMVMMDIDRLSVIPTSVSSGSSMEWTVEQHQSLTLTRDQRTFVPARILIDHIDPSGTRDLNLGMV